MATSPMLPTRFRSCCSRTQNTTIHSTQRVLARASVLTDLTLPDGVRAGHLAEDLMDANGKLAVLDTLYDQECEDHAYAILGRLFHYHPGRREEAPVALWGQIARLRRGSPDASP